MASPKPTMVKQTTTIFQGSASGLLNTGSECGSVAASAVLEPEMGWAVFWFIDTSNILGRGRYSDFYSSGLSQAQPGMTVEAFH